MTHHFSLSFFGFVPFSPPTACPSPLFFPPEVGSNPLGLGVLMPKPLTSPSSRPCLAVWSSVRLNSRKYFLTFPLSASRRTRLIPPAPNPRCVLTVSLNRCDISLLRPSLGPRFSCCNLCAFFHSFSVFIAVGPFFFVFYSFRGFPSQVLLYPSTPSRFDRPSFCGSENFPPLGKSAPFCPGVVKIS